MGELWMIILFSVLGVVVVGLIVFLILHILKKKKIRESDLQADKKVEEAANGLANCFGGNDNIQSISQQGSRVTILVKDMEKIDKDAISAQIPSVMYMGNKIVCVIGSKSEEFTQLLKSNIEKSIAK